MSKKILTAFLLFTALMLISVSSFANNDSSFGNTMQESADKTQTTIQNAGSHVGNAVQDIGNGVMNFGASVGNGIQNMFDGDDQNTTTGQDNDNNTVTGAIDDGTYTATRTSADIAGTTEMGNTAWIWLILGITGIVIVALTWYYVGQNTDNRNH